MEVDCRYSHTSHAPAALQERVRDLGLSDTGFGSWGKDDQEEIAAIFNSQPALARYMDRLIIYNTARLEHVQLHLPRIAIFIGLTSLHFTGDASKLAYLSARHAVTPVVMPCLEELSFDIKAAYSQGVKTSAFGQIKTFITSLPELKTLTVSLSREGQDVRPDIRDLELPGLLHEIAGRLDYFNVDSCGVTLNDAQGLCDVLDGMTSLTFLTLSLEHTRSLADSLPSHLPQSLITLHLDVHRVYLNILQRLVETDYLPKMEDARVPAVHKEQLLEGWSKRNLPLRRMQADLRTIRGL